MLYGYARCSTNECKQDIDRQIRELKQQGVQEENIFLEYESGTKENRAQLNRLLNHVVGGDTIATTEVSRITRSIKQLCEIIELAKTRQLRLVFGSFVVDCSTTLDPMTEGMLKMMGVFSELERNIISQRVKSGMANAREKGARIGRRPTEINDIPQVFIKHYILYQSGKINKRELAKLADVSYPTVYKYIRLLEET